MNDKITKAKAKADFAAFNKALSDDVLKQVYYLKDRWNDEREYEDWATYRAAFAKLFPEAKLLKLSKSFTAELRINSVRVRVQFAANGRVSIRPLGYF